jgi:hypothetical protein
MTEPSVPIACTLSPNQLGGRLAEWHELLATSLRRVERPAPRRLRLVLAADADVESVRDLAAREQECCAFMAFAVSPGDGELLVVDVEVPAAATPTLDGLAGLALRAGGGALTR